MSEGSKPLSHPAQRRYPAELRERATRMVLEGHASGQRYGVVSRIARQLGIEPETLRNWVHKAEVDEGQRPGGPTKERARIAELEREVKELRRSNEILKAASIFFAAELDRPQAK
jgi:transposase